MSSRSDVMNPARGSAGMLPMARQAEDDDPDSSESIDAAADHQVGDPIEDEPIEDDAAAADHRRGALRGEVGPTGLTHRIAGVGPGLIRQQYMVYGAPIPDDVVLELVDSVLMPLIRT